MAKDAVDHVAEDLGISSKSRTRWIRLGARDVEALALAVQRRCRVLGLSGGVAVDLVRRYGDRALDVLDIAHAEGLTDPLVDGPDPIAAEAVYTSRAEMTTHLNDLLMRRTRLALVDPEAGIGPTGGAAKLLAGEFGWSRRETRRQVDAHRAEVERERGLPLRKLPKDPRDVRDADTG